jgi:hypothetical protein
VFGYPEQPAVALGNFVALLTLFAAFLLFAPNAASAEAPRICLDDSERALARFAEFHELATRNLYRARSVSPKQRYFVDLASDAATYVGAHEGAALLVFAWDENDLCLFFWAQKSQAPGDYVYVRHPGMRTELLTQARLLDEIVRGAKIVANRLPRKRSATVVDTPDPPIADPVVVTKTISKLLFPPEVRGELGTVKHLSIVPVGPVATIPLFMLKPLGDERTVAELFSINILTLMEDIQAPMRWRHAATDTALVIGNPATGDDEWDFPDLPGAEEEARFAHGILGGTILTRQDATLERFESFAPNADIIVIAAHGVSDSDDPLDGSFLALADGRLSPRQIQSLELQKHPLVILSACQSGLGRALDAGVIGLARAFQIAGAADTIMSLWSIDDDATRFMMEHFYRLLLTRSPAEALRLATVETRQRYPDPAQWASFALFGGP